MNTQLYKLAEENIETILSYYKLIKERSEKYNSFITKFTKITRTYCSNIKNIFDNEEILSKNYDNITKENIQKKVRKKSIRHHHMNIDIDISERQILKKKINVTPIELNMAKINDLFKNYINCIELFTTSLENQNITLTQNLEQTKTKINEVKNNYSTEKQNFFQKYSEFDELNKKLNMKYYEQEKGLVEFLLKKKPSKMDATDENNINLKIYNAKIVQKEIISQFKNLGNFGKSFNDSYNKILTEIKEIVSEFFKTFETLINHILILYKKSFIIPITELTSDNKIMDLKEKEFNEIINNIIKNIEAKSCDICFDEYKIKVLNQNIDDESEEDENTKNLINLIKNSHIEIDGKDIFFIVKKMYNFSYIDKKEYILDKEKEKLNLDEKLEKLFTYSQKINDNSECNILSEVNNNNDKKDKDNINSNLQIEKNDDNLVKEDIIMKNGPNKADVDYICKLMNQKVFRNYILLKLNKHRTTGHLGMTEVVYNYFVQILLAITKYLVEEKQTEQGKELIIDYDATRFIFILSQTFYCVKNGKKYYFQHGLKNEKIFHSVEFWIKLLQHNIKEETEKLITKSIKKYTEKEAKEKESEICLMQLLPYITGFNGFEIGKDKINEIANFFINEYQLKDEDKKIILNSIENNGD